MTKLSVIALSQSEALNARIVSSVISIQFCGGNLTDLFDINFTTHTATHFLYKLIPPFVYCFTAEGNGWRFYWIFKLPGRISTLVRPLYFISVLKITKLWLTSYIFVWRTTDVSGLQRNNFNVLKEKTRKKRRREWGWKNKDISSRNAFAFPLVCFSTTFFWRSLWFACSPYFGGLIRFSSQIVSRRS